MKDEGKQNCLHFILHPSAFILAFRPRVNCSAGFIVPLHNAATAAGAKPPGGVRAAQGRRRTPQDCATREGRVQPARTPFPFYFKDIWPAVRARAARRRAACAAAGASFCRAACAAWELERCLLKAQGVVVFGPEFPTESTR
jgi:hypothetical protein